MAVDLFNNISNDYIYPDLAPCPGANDGNDSRFEFLPNEQAGIISGSDIVAAMNLGDISQPVSGWNQQTKILQPGEVTFIPGLTKGLMNQTQIFLFDPLEDLYDENANYENLTIDLSLNYYRNFKHYDVAIHAAADEDTPIDVALDMAFDAQNILISTSYDASGITFTGDNPGYQIDITNVYGMDGTTGEFLTLDTSNSIPAFKYPNTGMLGYVLKATYPSVAQAYESYVEINHVPDYLEHFTLIEDATCAGYYVRHYDKVDVGLSSKTLCDASTMGAGDYLAYIEENNKWEKVGPLRIWISALDPANSAIENLITGFYVFNPHNFPIKIDYMIIA